MTFLIHYVDDSGSPTHGFAVFSWVAVDATQWKTALDSWLAFREQLWLQHEIPMDFEIHSAEFLYGRGRPSRDDRWNTSKQARRDVFQHALRTIRELPGVWTGAAFRPTACRRHDYSEEMLDLYRALASHLEKRLECSRDQGLILMDGDGTAHLYQSAHREAGMPTPQMIEDLSFRPAHLSDWIQMADIVAHTAFQSVAEIKYHEFCWGWYKEHLDERGPQLM
jgi:hypothetical protein